MLTAEGVKALLKVKAQKLARPESLNMATFIKTECNGSGNTVSCIAGQLVINNHAPETGLELKQETFKEWIADPEILNMANKILGFAVDDWQSLASLFDISYWPEEFYQAYKKAGRSSKERAEIVGQVIDLFIETNYKPG